MTRSYLSLGTVALLLISCGGGGDTTAPTSAGSLVVKTATGGSQRDPNGYTLTSTAVGGSVPIGIDTAIRKDDLTPGSYPITLSGLAGNCHAPALTDTAHVVDAGIDTVRFAVTCDSTFGSVVVQTMTSGPLPDPDGYRLQLGGGAALPLSVNGTTPPVTKPSGPNSLSLSGVAGNCTIIPALPADLVVTAGVTDTLSIEVQCGYPALIAQQELSANDGIIQMNPDGTMSTLLLPESGGATFSRPTWSPDGAGIAFDQIEGGGAWQHAIGILATDSTTPWLLVADSGDTFKPRWRPDGGALLVVRQADTSLYRIAVISYPGGGMTPVSPDTLQVGSGDWSPDGTKIVFTASLPGFGTQLLFVMSANGTNVAQIPLPGGVADIFQPRWSPTGDRIVFSAGSGQVFWTIGPNGSSPAEVAVHGYRPFGIASWAPSGSSLIVAAQDSTTGGYVMLHLNPSGTILGVAAATAGAWENPDWR